MRQSLFDNSASLDDAIRLVLMVQFACDRTFLSMHLTADMRHNKRYDEMSNAKNYGLSTVPVTAAHISVGSNADWWDGFLGDGEPRSPVTSGRIYDYFASINRLDAIATMSRHKLAKEWYKCYDSKHLKGYGKADKYKLACMLMLGIDPFASINEDDSIDPKYLPKK